MKNISKLSILVLMLVFVCKMQKQKLLLRQPQLKIVIILLKVNCTCPMHPEVTGKQGEECSKCGMELTEPVANKEVEKTMEVL
jgi:hypothetical protein